MFQVEDVYTPNYHCGFGDLICAGNESVARIVASWVHSAGDFAGTMLQSAFDVNSIKTEDWNTAFVQFWWWASVMAVVVLLVLCYQIGVSAVMQDFRRMGRSTIGAFVAVPFSAVAVQVMSYATKISDNVTHAAIQNIQGGTMGDALYRMTGMMSVVGATDDPAMSQSVDFDTHSVIYKLLAQGGTAKSIGDILTAAVVIGSLGVAALFLFIAMSIRDFGLLALAALAPVGLMMIGQAKLGVWAERWVSMATGLILAKPLAAGVLVLAVKLSLNTVDISTLLVSIGAILAAAFAPLWAVKLVSFAGNEVGNALHRRPSMTAPIQKFQTIKGLAR